MTDRDSILALRKAQLSEGHSRNTRKVYRYWVLDYRRHRQDRRAADLQQYLDVLIHQRRLHAKTIHQAVCALVFYHKQVLRFDPGKLKFPKIKKGARRRMPTVLSHTECLTILAGLDRVPRLQASLLYGCGLRIEECITLRVKDIDLHHRTITIHGGKGDKDRIIKLPDSILPALSDQVRRCTNLHRQDKADGLHCPDDSESLMRKLGRPTFASLPWYWLFPSRVTRGSSRWHANRHTLSKAIKTAAEAAGITKRVTAHGLRHSYATTLLRNCVDIRTIQTQLGHEHVETTEIYAHAAAMRTAPSPLDQSPVIVPFTTVIPRQAVGT